MQQPGIPHKHRHLHSTTLQWVRSYNHLQDLSGHLSRRCTSPTNFQQPDPDVTICYDQGVTLSIPGLPSSTAAVATAVSGQSSTSSQAAGPTTSSQAASPPSTIKSNDAGAPPSPTAPQTVVDAPTTTTLPVSHNDASSSRVNILAGIAALALNACLL